MRGRAARIEINEVLECRMKISGAFSGEGEENIGGEVMMFGVVGEFGVVGF